MHRRNVRIVALVAALAASLAACALPATPPPPPLRHHLDDRTTTTHHHHDHVTTTTPTTTTLDDDHRPRPPSGGPAPRTVRSAAARSFPPTTRGTATSSALPVARQLAATTSTPSPPSAANKKLHADFGGDGEYGIPYITVPGQPGARSPIDFVDYGDESDPGPYPIPTDAPVEGGGDRARPRGRPRQLQALRAVRRRGDGRPLGRRARARSSTSRSNALRPEGWTSADAAGLPIFPGLVRYDEVASGHIDHALRFTVSQSQTRLHPPRDALGVVEHRRRISRRWACACG